VKDRLATFEKRSLPGDPFGQAELTWEEIRLAFVSLEPLRGQELLQAQQTEAQVTHRVKLDYFNDIGPEHRMKVRNELEIGGNDDQTDDKFWRIFHIESAINWNEQNRELHLMCREKV